MFLDIKITDEFRAFEWVGLLVQHCSGHPHQNVEAMTT